MKIKNLILCGVMGVALMSCATKQSAINQFRAVASFPFFFAFFLLLLPAV